MHIGQSWYLSSLVCTGQDLSELRGLAIVYNPDPLGLDEILARVDKALWNAIAMQILTLIS